MRRGGWRLEEEEVKENRADGERLSEQRGNKVKQVCLFCQQMEIKCFPTFGCGFIKGSTSNFCRSAFPYILGKSQHLLKSFSAGTKFAFRRVDVEVNDGRRKVIFSERLENIVRREILGKSWLRSVKWKQEKCCSSSDGVKCDYMNKSPCRWTDLLISHTKTENVAADQH